MLLSTLRNWAVFVLLESRTALAASNVNKIIVHPEELSQTGYWTESYHERCGIELHESYGANSGLSYTFEGSGIVVRLLHCENCAQVEITIDEEIPTLIDLSEPNGDEGTFKCPHHSPSFFNTDLEHGKHNITITRLNAHLGRPFKVREFEYLTTNAVIDKNNENPDVMAAIGGVLKGIAKDAGKIAVGGVVGYGVQFAVDAALKGAGFGGLPRDNARGSSAAGDENTWEDIHFTSSSSGNGGYD